MKRSKGDGSAFATKDRKGRGRWVCQLALGDGRTVKRWLDVCTHRVDDVKECEKCSSAATRKLQQMRDQRARGEFNPKPEPEPDGEPEPEALPTVREWVATWLDAGAPGGRKGTGPGAQALATYRSLARNDVDRRPIGAIRLDELRRSDVNRWLIELADAGKARGTLVKVLSMLDRAYRYAQLVHEDALGHGRPNPCEDVPLPPTTTKPKGRRSLAGNTGVMDEIREVLAAVAGHRLLDAWVHLALDAPTRPGELMALEWSDLDLDGEQDEENRPTVTIVKSIAWEPDEHGKVRPILTDTKTGQMGHRRLTLSDSTVAALKAHKRRQGRERLAAGTIWPPNEHGIALANRVFLTPLGKLVDRHHVRRQLHGATRARKLSKVNAYDLRHTSASLVDEFHTEDVASKALGHVRAGGSATAGYVHRWLKTIPSAVLDIALQSDAQSETLQAAQ